MKDKQVTDNQLVKRYVKGDETAIAHLIARHQSNVFGYIMKLVKDRQLADDLFQDTFFKVVQKIKEGKYADEGRFVHWVLRIAYNIFVDHYRESRKMPSVSHVSSKNGGEEKDIFSVLDIEGANHVNKWEAQEEMRELRQMVKLLPKEQRQIVILHIYFGMSYREIGEMFNLNVNTALGRMHYALMSLKKMAKTSIVLNDELKRLQQVGQ
jgi:RNA polymerase sigma-70 factor (ECF subfamily)